MASSSPYSTWKNQLFKQFAIKSMEKDKGAGILVLIDCFQTSRIGIAYALAFFHFIYVVFTLLIFHEYQDRHQCGSF